jgi:hypothetical protein
MPQHITTPIHTTTTIAHIPLYHISPLQALFTTTFLITSLYSTQHFFTTTPSTAAQQEQQ